jgi:Uncharacterized conserved protein (DUF2039)
LTWHIVRDNDSVADTNQTGTVDVVVQSIADIAAMPQPTNPTKKKKASSSNGGRIPAYQNTFAFKHNPKSKKTAAILASPIYHCCQRCHDKIAWRKQYRKYKPLTQPSVCNLCNKRNVMAAYHTVCDACSTNHAQAVDFLRQWNADDAQKSLSTSMNDGLATADEAVAYRPMKQSKIVENASSQRYTRVCTVCFKHPALSDTNESDSTGAAGQESLNHEKPLKLRQIKSLRRQSEKKSNKGRTRDNTSDRNATETDDRCNSDSEYDEKCSSDDEMSAESDEDPKKEVWPVAAATTSLVEDDPFLAAIGGVQNLLVGEAYQAKLLEKSCHESFL